LTRVLITGGSGFTGQRVIKFAIARGLEVVALARSEKAAEALQKLGVVEVVNGDLDCSDSLSTAFKNSRATMLINVASLGFGHTPAILSAAASANIRRAVFVSTTAIFTKLNVPSKKIRLKAEADIKSSQLDWTIIRPTMIYGRKGDRNMERLVRFLSKMPIIVLPGGGKGLQQPIYVDDLADVLVVSLLSEHAIGKSYNVAGLDQLDFRSVVKTTCEHLNTRVFTLSIPNNILKFVVRILVFARLPLNINEEQFDRLAEDKIFSFKDAEVDLNFKPRSFSDGIEQEIEMLGYK